MKRLVLMFLVLGLISCSDSGNSNTIEAKNSNKSPYSWVNTVHTEIGVPFDQDTTNDYIIIRPQYVLSYNNELGVPNWVAWELNANWFGDVARYSGNFITDNSLPENFIKIKHSDYTNSGYDRGHQVRSEERTLTVDDNKSSFFMTNILPQTPDLNQGVWLKFEYYCESLCKEQNKELLVVSGGIFNTKSTLNSAGKVAIPDSCWKIVLILDKGQKIKDINANNQVYAICIPNISGVRKADYATYKTTIDKIEQSTGYDFFSELEDKIEAAIEKK